MLWLIVLLAFTAATFAKLGSLSVLVRVLSTGLGLSLFLLGYFGTELRRRSQR